jgi:hypothetical protein
MEPAGTSGASEATRGGAGESEQALIFGSNYR